jgi:hypothetical protein
MAVYCIGYVIGESGVHSLDGPKDHLRALGPMFEVTPSTWLVSTTLHCRGILEHLEAVIGDTDQLVVFEVARQAEWAITQGTKVTEGKAAAWFEQHVRQD